MATIPTLSKFLTQDGVTNRAQDQNRDAFNTQAKSINQTQQTQKVASSVKALQNTTGTASFDASKSSHFTLTLKGNVTASSLTGLSAGQVVTFVISQDAAGGHTFAWPAYVNGNKAFLVRGAGAIGAAANTASSQRFMFDGSTLWAVGPIQTGM